MITMITRSGVLQALVEKERWNTHALLEEAKREAAEREREMEERTAKLLEEERNWNEESNRAYTSSSWYVSRAYCNIPNF